MISGNLRTLQKRFWGVLFIFLLFFCSRDITAQPDDKSYHILFIGNSYTYFNSMPQMFKAMAESQFPDDTINVKFIGGGGATLKEHWEVGEALREIKSGYWDYVVLQGQSMLGSRDLTNNDSPKQFYDYARKLNAEIINSGAKTVFFMTWSRKRLPEQQKYLTKAYQTIAKELGSLLAPVGLVWGKFHEISTIDLYMPDGSHPSKTGTFLSALTLFGAVFQTIPDDISGTLYGQEILRGGKLSIEKTRLCDLSKEQVKLLRKAVADVMFQKEKK